MQRSLRWLALALVFLLSVSRTGTAQGSAGTSRFCFRRQPPPSCDAFWIVELGYYSAFATTVEVGRELMAEHASLDIGVMRNRSRAASGVLLTLGRSEEGPRIGVLGRRRHWLGSTGTLDITAGVVQGQVAFAGSPSGTGATGVSGDIALGWRDLGQIVIRADALRSKGRTATGVYAGGRLGSYPAVAAAIIGAVTYSVFVANRKEDVYSASPR